MKKLLATVLVTVMAIGTVSACGSKTTETATPKTTTLETTTSAAAETKVAGEKKEIAIMVPSADHGWTGAVLAAAQQKADELNADTSLNEIYTFKVYAATDAENQIQQVDDLLTNTEKLAGIALLPYDNGMQSTLEKAATAGIPIAQFDRVLESDIIDTTCVANVRDDNLQIGYLTAERYLKDGLTKEDIVFELIGDTSSVPEQRSQGFRNALLDNGWTEEEIDAVITKSASTGWSRDTGKELFETWFGSAQCDPSKEIYIFTHDDNLVVGVLESLNGAALDATKKDAFLKNFKGVAGCSLPGEMYAILEGTHKTLSIPEGCDLFSVTYDPAHIQIAVDCLVASLNGEAVEQDQTTAVDVVDTTNYSDFTPFDTYAE